MFAIETSNPQLLNRARQVADRYAATKMNENTVGIVFLGAVARGYFDVDSDIDIAIFERNGNAETKIETQLIDGFEVQTFLSDYENSKTSSWEMSKRWAFSNTITYFQRDESIVDLLKMKVDLQSSERVHMMKFGITLAEWYCNRLPELWIRRLDVLSAHSMFLEGLNHYLTALYALNNELVADYKWRVFCSRHLKQVPHEFQTRLAQFLETREISIEEIDRRRKVFLSFWSETLPMIEDLVGMKYDEFRNTI